MGRQAIIPQSAYSLWAEVYNLSLSYFIHSKVLELEGEGNQRVLWALPIEGVDLKLTKPL